MDPSAEISEVSREAGPSGAQLQNNHQNAPQAYPGAGHDCQGARCVCQRYENGELALVVMSQNRNGHDRDDGYQNTGRGARNVNGRGNSAIRVHPAVNQNYQNYQNYAAWARNLSRNRQQQEPEENIYERLDNDEDDDDEHNSDAARNEARLQNHQNVMEDHTYERIDNRYSCRGGGQCFHYRYHFSANIPGPSFLNDIDSRNLSQYDQPQRHAYLDSSHAGQLWSNRLGRLGRNCFSSENISYASTKRGIPPIPPYCMCPLFRRLHSKYIRHNFHIQNVSNRLRYQDGNNSTTNGSSRHYIYQVSRNCRCSFCGGDSTYVKLPINSNRLPQQLRGECHCRNAANCTCRNQTFSNSNSTMHIGRYLDWINRVGTSVNNPLYATIHIGRFDRPCASGLNNSINGSNGQSSSSANNDAKPSTSSAASVSGPNEPSTSTNLRSVFSPGNPSTSNTNVSRTSRAAIRQHTCDDSCIRNGNIAGICQFVGRCDRAECNHGRLSVHWWFVNKFLPHWSMYSNDRNMGSVSVEEEPREQQESDSDEAQN